MNKTLTCSLIILLPLLVALLFAFTDTYDVTTPAGTDDPREADDRMRETKAALQERLNKSLFFDLTGNEVSDSKSGYLRDPISVEAYGAVSDATGVAGVGTDNYTAIQNCITGAGENAVILFPGFYRIAQAVETHITLLSGQQLIGNGWGTGIFYDSSDQSISTNYGAFYITGAVNNIRIANMYLQGRQDDTRPTGSGGSTSGTMIIIEGDDNVSWANNPQHIIIENCKFNDGYQAIAVIATLDNTYSPDDIMVRNCHIEDNEHGIMFYNMRGTATVSDTTFEATGRIQRGIASWSSRNINISNIQLRGDDWAGPGIYFKTDDDDPAINNINVNNVISHNACDVEYVVEFDADTGGGGTSNPLISSVAVSNVSCSGNDTNYAVRVVGEAAGHIENMSISNVTSLTDIIQVSYAKNVTISNCALESTTDALLLSNVDGLTVTGCSFNLADASSGGVVFQQSSGSSANVVVTGNLFYGAGYTSTPRGVETNTGGSVDGLIVANNLFYQIDYVMNVEYPVTNGKFTDNVVLGSSVNEFRVDYANSGTWSGAIDRNIGLASWSIDQDHADVTVLSDSWAAIVADTDGITLTRAQSGTLITNEGVGNATHMVATLPSAVPGMIYPFCATDSDTDTDAILKISPNASDKIAGASAVDKDLYLDVQYESATLVCPSDNLWIIKGYHGTLSYEP